MNIGIGIGIEWIIIQQIAITTDIITARDVQSEFNYYCFYWWQRSHTLCKH